MSRSEIQAEHVIFSSVSSVKQLAPHGAIGFGGSPKHTQRTKPPASGQLDFTSKQRILLSTTQKRPRAAAPRRGTVFEPVPFTRSHRPHQRRHDTPPPPARNYNSHHAPRGHPHGRRREGAAGAAGSCSSDRDGAAVIANVQRAERELPAPGRKRGWWGRQRGRGPGAGCGGGPGRPLRCLGLRYAPGRGGVFGVLRLLQQRGVLGAAGQVRAEGRGGFRGRRRGMDGRRDGPFWGWASQRYPPQL